MSLQKADLSQAKPDGIGNSKILQEIMSSGGRIAMPGSSGKRDFAPEYFKPTSVSYQTSVLAVVSLLSALYFTTFYSFTTLQST